MKRAAAAILGMVVAAASLSLAQFFSHHPWIYHWNLRFTFWLNLALCAAAFGLWQIFRMALRRPQAAPGSQQSKKQAELEEKLAYLSKIYQDLSNSLRMEKQKVELIIGCAPDGIFTFSPAGVITSWNRSMESLTGIAARQAVGKDHADILRFFSTHGQQLVDPFAPCLAEGKNASLPDCRMEADAGKNFPVSIGAAPVPAIRRHGSDSAESAATEEIIVTVKDIRLQKEAERLKEEMVAMISHDLRSPLSAMLGYAGLMSNPKLCPTDVERVKYLEALCRSGKGMLLLINNLLQTAGMEDGKLSVEKRPVPLQKLLEEAVEELEPLARGRNLSLQVECSPDLAALTDPEKLHEILINLLANAVKFSRPGESVWIRAREEETRVKLAVADSGPGISEEEKSRLFEKFSSVRKVGSATGLGLYIVSRLTSALDGSVEVESQPGKGSTFVIALPLYKAPESADPGRQLSLLTGS